MTKGKKVMILAPLAIFVVVGAWQGLRYAWFHSYSKGSRTGTIRKVSIKGPPVCKYLSGELALVGGAPGGAPEIFRFTVDDIGDANPLLAQLHEAEKSAKTVTLDYREDKSKWWACADTDYYVTAVEK